MTQFDFLRFKKNNTSDDQDRNIRCTGTEGIRDTPLNMEFTPEKIEFLGKRDIFVFGSNLAGKHAGGAARVALNRFGAVWGQGEGLQGNSYAIPTMQGNIDSIQSYVDKFIEFAEYEKALTFYFTKIGCGIAGFNVKDIAPLFIKALSIDNIILPREFVEIAMESQHKLINNDIVTHAHGVTRTFAGMVLAMNDHRHFTSASEVMDISELSIFNTSERFAIGLGEEADIASLVKFTGNPDKVYSVTDLDKLLDCITMTIVDTTQPIPLTSQPSGNINTETDEWE